MSVDSKTRILKAATVEFVKKGKSGARMHEIAARAKINKAMLHYYFASKDNLFDEVIRTILNQMLSNFDQVYEMRGDPREVVAEFLRRVNAFWDAHGDEMIMVFQAVRNRNKMAMKVLKTFYGKKRNPIQLFSAMHARGQIREQDPRQVLLHMIGSIIFYHFIKAGLIHIWGIKDGEFQEARVASLMDLFSHGLFTEDSKP